MNQNMISIKTGYGCFRVLETEDSKDPPHVTFHPFYRERKFHGEAIAALRTLISVHRKNGIDVSTPAYCAGVAESVEHAIKDQEG